MTTVRRADAHDVPALVRLRAEMFTDFLGDAGTGWQDAAAAWFHAAVDNPACYVGVVDGPDAVAVACILVQTTAGPPAPHNLTGRRGDLSNVCTDPAFRGRGYAGALLDAALAWADAEGVGLLDLRATDKGRHLYEARGFTSQDRAMRRRRPVAVRGMAASA